MDTTEMNETMENAPALPTDEKTTAAETSSAWVCPDFKVSGIFSSHMVLQREKPIKIWGFSNTPGSRVAGSFMGETVTATVTVKNVGDRTGKTVVQLYVRDVESTPIRPIRELKGFEKVELRPGETKQVNITLDKRSFAYWNQQIHDWHVETGEFAIEIGQSSRDICLSETVQVNSTVAIPTKFTMDSIVLDIIDDPEAMEALAPVMGAIKEVFAPQDGPETAANEAITEEMNMAMLKYMPLRGILSFGGGNIDLTGIQLALGMPTEE